MTGHAIGGAVSDSAGGYSIDVKLHHATPAVLYGAVDDFGPIRRALALSPSMPQAATRADFALGSEDESGLLPDVRLVANPGAHTLIVDCSSGKYESGKKHLVIENSRGEEMAFADFSADHAVLDISALDAGAYLARVGDVLSAFVVRK
ncbi:MAG: hypothetical protein JWQ98_2155 [Chlorobi bacterium]|nr:hypothetical protein [Chlorobiota bacterium]